MSSIPMKLQQVRVHARLDSVWTPWLLAWVGASVIAIANGIARRALYEQRTGVMGAHYVSTASLIALLGAYMWLVAGRWPIPTRRTALLIGSVWTMLTIGFEFGLGRFVVGDAWAKLVEQYDVSRGNIWILVPLWTALGPALMGQVRANDTYQNRRYP
jgi:hypothetical protein